MGDFNLFEAHEASGDEERREAARAGDKLAAAISEVRRQFGSFLFQAADRGDFEDRVALCKDDMIRTVDAHVMPVTGTMRRVVRAVREDWEAQRTARIPSWEESELEGYPEDTYPGEFADEPFKPDWKKRFEEHHGKEAASDAESVCHKKGHDWDDDGHGGANCKRCGTTYAAQMARGGSRRRADAPVLEPEGDFHGYLDDVAPQAESKAGENFVTTGPVNEHTGDPADTDFAKAAWRQAAGNWDDDDPEATCPGCGEVWDKDDMEVVEEEGGGDLDYHCPACAGRIRGREARRRRAGFDSTDSIVTEFDTAAQTWADSGRDDDLEYLNQVREELLRRAEEGDEDAAEWADSPMSGFGTPESMQDTSDMIDGMGFPSIRRSRRQAGYGAKSYDIAGYQYQGDHFMPQDLIEYMVANGDLSPAARDMDPEEVLDQHAGANGIDRYDENTFDSGEFPKVIFNSDVSEDDADWYREGRRGYRTAGGDPLGTAAEAITQELQEQAEQFQQAIEPLQQALQAVDYAQQVQQSQQPLNVQPGEGTVQVIPERNPVPQPIPTDAQGVMPQQLPGPADPNDPYGQAAQQQVQARRRRQAAENVCHQKGHDWDFNADGTGGEKCKRCGTTQAYEHARSGSRRRRSAGRIDTLQSIVDNHQAQKIDGFLVDAQTANLLLQIHGKGNDRTKNTIETAPLDRVADAAWGLTKKSSRGRRPFASGRRANEHGGLEWAEGYTPDEDDIRDRKRLRNPESGELAPGESWGGRHASGSYCGNCGETADKHDAQGHCPAPDLPYYKVHSDGSESRHAEPGNYLFDFNAARTASSRQLIDRVESGDDGAWEELRAAAMSGDPLAGAYMAGDNNNPQRKRRYRKLYQQGRRTAVQFTSDDEIDQRRAEQDADWWNQRHERLKGEGKEDQYERELADHYKRRQTNPFGHTSSRGRRPFGDARLAERWRDDTTEADMPGWERVHANDLKPGDSAMVGRWFGVVRDVKPHDSGKGVWVDLTGDGNYIRQRNRTWRMLPETVNKEMPWVGTAAIQKNWWQAAGGGPVAKTKPAKPAAYPGVPKPPKPKQMQAARSVGLIGRGNAHRPAGWEWDAHLAAFKAGGPRLFSCSCGTDLDMPGYRKCGGCGKVWNGYAIGHGGDTRTAQADTYLVREIPVRKDVILASRREAAIRQANRHLVGYDDDPQWYKDQMDSLSRKPSSQQNLDEARREFKRWVSTSTGNAYDKAIGEKLRRRVKMFENDVAREKEGRQAGRMKDLWMQEREAAGEDPEWDWPSDVGQAVPKVSDPPVDWHRRDSGGKWTPPGLPAKRGRRSMGAGRDHWIDSHHRGGNP